MALITGIDTGSWRTRLVQMEGSFRRLTVGEAREVPSPWEEGQPQLTEAIQLLAEGDKTWSQGEKVVAFPMEQATIRVVKLPFTDKAVIERTLPSEVEAGVPFDMDDMLLATRIIEVQAGHSRTLALLVRRDVVRRRLEALEKAGADPKMMPVDADLLAAYATRGVQVVLDVGHRRCVIALCQGGSLIAGRVLDSGSSAWTGAIAESGLAWEQAEQYKHQANVAALTEVEAEWVDEETTSPRSLAGLEPPQRALEESVRAWSLELRTALVALEDLYGVGVDELLLAGGGSQLNGLGAYLSAMLGVPARAVVVPGGHPPSFALAAAAARAGAGEVKIADLRIGEFVHQGAAQRLWTLVTWGGGALALGVVAAVVLFAVQLSDAYGRVDELDQQIKDTVTQTFPDVPAVNVTSPSQALAIMQERTTETSRRVEALGSTVGGLPPTLELLKQISAGVPAPTEARIDVRELTISSDSIVMKAETDSYETAAKIEESLKRQSGFSGAKKGEEKKVGEVLQFTMTIPLGEAEAEEPAAGGGEG